MPAQDPNTGVRYALSTDAPSIDFHTKNMTDDLRKLVVPAFASAAARDAAITGSTSVVPALGPTTGQMCTVAGIPYVYVGGAWLALDVNAAWIPLTLAANWSGIGTGVPLPSYRRKGGLIEFSGSAFYTGAIGVGGVALTASNSTIAAAVPTNAGNTWSTAIPGQQSVSSPAAAAQLLALVDGRLFVQFTSTTTGGGVAVSLNGATLRDIAAG